MQLKHSEASLWTAVHASTEQQVSGLQVHDEVILEGLKETAAEAKALVIKHMMHPFNGQNPLQVALNVDAKSADTWYEAK